VECFKVLSRKSLGETEENHEKSHQCSRLSGRDSNRVPPDTNRESYRYTNLLGILKKILTVKDAKSVALRDDALLSCRLHVF
jgi:hypothetical protein